MDHLGEVGFGWRYFDVTIFSVGIGSKWIDRELWE